MSDQPTTSVRTDVAAELDSLPVSRFHYTALGVASTALLFESLDFALIGFVLPVVQKAWVYEAYWTGIIPAAGTAGYALGVIAGGWAADRWGRRRIILWTLLGFSLFSVARGFADGVASLTLWHVLALIFCGAEAAIVPTYLAELWPKRRRGALNGWMMSFFSYGAALTPLWALLIIPLLDWRWALWLTAPFAIFAAVLRRKLPESPRWLASKGRHEEAEREMVRIRSRSAPAVAAEGDDAAVEQAPPRKGSFADLFRADYRSRTVMLGICWFAATGIIYVFTTFVPSILAGRGYSIVHSYTFTWIIYLSYIPGYLVSGYIADRVDRKWTICLGLGVSALSGMAFATFTSQTFTLVFGSVSAFASTFTMAAVYLYTTELFPTQIRARGFGVSSFCGRLGSISFLLYFGILGLTKSLMTGFVTAAVVLAAAILALLVWGPRTRRISLEVTSGQRTG